MAMTLMTHMTLNFTFNVYKMHFQDFPQKSSPAVYKRFSLK